MAVPSVVVPNQLNYLINPQHPDLAGLIEVTDRQNFMLDIRLFDALNYP